jgi:hypothetical protein
MTCEIYMTLPETVKTHKSEIERLLQKVSDRDYNGMKVENYLSAILKDEMQLWTIVRNNEILAVIVTELTVYDNMMTCVVVGLAGIEMEDWLHLEPTIEAWAINEGCSAMEAFTRRGFAKVLKPFNYYESYTVMRKDLKNTNVLH